jgi:ssDNA-binding Zn-finger/Zn-ribbon topoisomerase 1
MVIRLGRNGRFLACSTFPEHKESRPLPGDEVPALPGTGEVCPKCSEGELTAKRGRFGPFVGCSRYPDCDYIKKDGPPPPPQLEFPVACPKNGDGHLIARRARRTGNVFWGCSAYPKCDYTTNFEPLGAVHAADDGSVARKGDGALCLECGAAITLPDGDVELVGRSLIGGPPDPAALARPARGSRRSGASRSGGAAAAGGRRRRGAAGASAAGRARRGSTTPGE